MIGYFIDTIELTTCIQIPTVFVSSAFVRAVIAREPAHRLVYDPVRTYVVGPKRGEYFFILHKCTNTYLLSTINFINFYHSLE